MKDDSKLTLDNEDYYDRSGCAAIAWTVIGIALFWIAVGVINLFT